MESDISPSFIYNIIKCLHSINPIPSNGSTSKSAEDRNAPSNLPAENGSIKRQELHVSPHTSRIPPKMISSTVPEQQWIISSSRPENPLDAFSIIISPRANPPPRILSGAYNSTRPNLPLEATSNSRPINGQAESKQTFHAEDGIDITSTHTEHRSTPNSSMTGSVTEKGSIPSSPLSMSTSFSVLSPTNSITSTPVVTSPTLSLDGHETLAAAPIKKSWASLLQSKDSASSKSANALPTSHVIGFSVPASESNPSPSLPIVPGKKSAIATLLSSGPTGSGGLPTIRPRGLVNTGNMCFANSVLQVLMYCGPFNRFFSDLGKHLTHVEAGNRINDNNSLPLLKATVQFLNEFKFKASKTGDDELQDDWLDSFIPTYMYDAMKEKKRFDSMRVRLLYDGVCVALTIVYS